MTTITIHKTAIPVIKSSLELREKLLRLKLGIYNRRLREFEKIHKMPTTKFLKILKAGKLKDEAYVIEWEYLSESYQSIKEQLNQIQRIKI